MRFLTFTALAGLVLSLGAQAANGPPGLASKPGGAPVASPNRTPSSQLPGLQRGPLPGPAGEPWGMMLVDRSGRPLGRAHPGFITNEPLVVMRINGLTTAVAGLAPDVRCDGARCQYGDSLSWSSNAPVRLVWRSSDCSGPPMVSYHPSAIGFEAIAFAVDDAEGRFLYQARSAPLDAVIGSWRRPGELTCQRGEAVEVEPVLPLEAVFSMKLMGQAPLRWR